MSTLQVTKIVTVDNNTPLILSTGNAGGGQIIVQSANTDVFFNGNINFSNYVTGDGSGLYIPSSNVANMAFNTANAAFAVANNVAPQVAPSYNTANSAYNTANAAFAKANVGGANVASTPPTSPVNGQLWWDQDTGRLFIYYIDGDSSQWVEATPTPEIDTNYYLLTNTAFDVANAAFIKANANYTTTNIAFYTANAAFATANNVAPQVTPSYNTANAAFDTANAAFASANNVAPQVEPSYRTANNAYNTANAAFGYANSLNTFVSVTYSTIVQLNYAWNQANIAYTVAAAAFDKANTAGGGYYAGNNGEKGGFNSGDIFRVHSNTMTESVTILAGNNAICAGPLNIVGANTTLTIQTGARVTIV